MDPVSAIGLASSIIAILDFSWELVAGTWEIYRSPDGTSDENAQLEDVIEDLKSLTDSLASQAQIPAKTTAENKIKRLAQYCQEDSQTLLDLLSGLRIVGKRRTIWRSLNSKWKSILKKNEVAQLKAQLQENRAEIQFHLTVMIQEDQSSIGMSLKNIKDDCDRLNIDIPRQLHELHDDLVGKLQNQKSPSSLEPSGERLPLSYIKQQLQDIQYLIQTIPLQHRVLRQLIPDNVQVESRRDQILVANPDTCCWILEGDMSPQFSRSGSKSSNNLMTWSPSDIPLEPGSKASRSRMSKSLERVTEFEYRRETRNGFISWLATGRDILHISGNAGSGKSTLMKFIGQHEITWRELKAWAGTKQLVFGQFYFWAAGSASQRTLPGLYRSLIFQALTQCPELIEKVFPHQLAQMRSSGSQGDQAVERLQGFNDAQVRDAFELLLQQTQHSHHRICFLLDGLDEFEGNRLDHEKLALKLKGWTAANDVKLLVSSRPWVEFVDIFRANPTIHLHELNRFDIMAYCLNSVAEDREVRRLENKQVSLALEDVVESIIDQSQGIFLWAHLVLDAILQGIRQSDSVTTLQQKVKEYPVDLDGLYSKLREPIEKSVFDRTVSNRMLLLAAKKPDQFRLTAVAISWILEEGRAGLLNPDFPTDKECRPYSEDEIAQRVERVTKQMNGLTRGLLVISPSFGRELDLDTANFRLTSWGSSEVEFSHRSARDYLLLNEGRYQTMRASWPRFDDTDVYGRCHLAQLLYCAVRDKNGNLCLRAANSLQERYCREFDIQTIRKFEAPIQPLLRASWSHRIIAPHIEAADDRAVSFLQYTAFCALDTFVRSEIFEAHQNLHSPGSSVLIAICSRLNGFGAPFLLQLLERRIGIDIMVEVYAGPSPKGKQKFAVPAWVVVFYDLLSNMTYTSTKARQEHYRDLETDTVLRYLHEYSGQVGHRLSFTMRIKEFPRKDHGQLETREYSSADIVEWAEEEAACVRKVAASHPADRGESSPKVRIGNDWSPESVQQTMSEWLQEAYDSGVERMRCLQADIIFLHWNSIHLELGKGLVHKLC